MHTNSIFPRNLYFVEIILLNVINYTINLTSQLWNIYNYINKLSQTEYFPSTIRIIFSFNGSQQ